jgi:hypothetical protein
MIQISRLLQQNEWRLINKISNLRYKKQKHFLITKKKYKEIQRNKKKYKFNIPIFQKRKIFLTLFLRLVKIYLIAA